MADHHAPLASITVVLAHARYVPAADRERLGATLRALIRDGDLYLETCHRVEAYGIGVAMAEVDVPPGARLLRGESAIRHAVALAVGRDSVVVGEDQVLHQLRVAVDAARASGRLDAVLERLFAMALRSGRLARSWRRGPERSLATLALAAAERQNGPIRGRKVVVVGAGRMGRLLARAAMAAGASVTVANRSPERAAELAGEVAGETAPFDPGIEIADVGGVFLAIRGRWSISATTTRALAASSTPVVDLSVPSAVFADLAAGLGARLITADDLARTEPEQPDDDRHLRRLDDLVDRTASEFLAWLDDRDRRAAAELLARRADRAREAELAVLWRRLPDLDEDSRAVIDAMTRHLAERLLREPLERLGHDADGRAERAVREAFSL